MLLPALHRKLRSGIKIQCIPPDSAASAPHSQPELLLSNAFQDTENAQQPSDHFVCSVPPSCYGQSSSSSFRLFPQLLRALHFDLAAHRFLEFGIAGAFLYCRLLFRTGSTRIRNGAVFHFFLYDPFQHCGQIHTAAARNDHRPGSIRPLKDLCFPPEMDSSSYPSAI